MEWVNVSPGVLSYGDSGIIIKYEAGKDMAWVLVTPDRRTLAYHTLGGAKSDAVKKHKELQEVGLA